MRRVPVSEIILMEKPASSRICFSPLSLSICLSLVRPFGAALELDAGVEVFHVLPDDDQIDIV